MKAYTVQILIVITLLVAGLTYLHQRAPHQQKSLAVAAPDAQQDKGSIEPTPFAPDPELAEEIVKPRVPVAIEPKKSKEHEEPQTGMTEEQRRALEYWKLAAQRFEKKMERLDQENDPARRMSLIRSMARNVRIDTPNTLDWAMNIENPEEQRAALEAINQNALVGIGAWLNVDETGLPQIMDTTVLSALGDTGMTEPGDYISGMENEDGSITYFQGLPLREIVQLLHGQPGTEVNLIMERAPAEDGSEPYSFEVPVQRSMIIMQPRFE